MNDVHDRIRERVASLKKSNRQLSIASGLNEYTISKLLSKEDQSQTLETIIKLSVGLETSPIWLAFGVDLPVQVSTCDSSPINSAGKAASLYRSPLQNNDCIQVSIGALRSLIMQALADLHVEDEEASAYADGVIECLSEQQADGAVVRLKAAVRNDPESQAPTPADPA